jgi:hypothetical protein
MTVFHTLADAIRDGYQVYDSKPGSYVLRKQIGGVWMMALCEPKQPEYRSPEHAWDQEV